MGRIIVPGVILSDSRTALRGKAARVSGGRISAVDYPDILEKKFPGDRVMEYPGAALTAVAESEDALGASAQAADLIPEALERARG